jgi:hypothetical protein
MNDELTPEEIRYRWRNLEPVQGLAFLLHDPVVVADGPHAGGHGLVVALEGWNSEPHYRVKLSSGGDLVLAQSNLASPVPPDMAAALSWLQTWYARRCDGDWEHEEGPSH